MTPKTKNGIKTVHLHAPEKRKLAEASMLLRQIAVAVPREEAEELNDTAQLLEQFTAKYAPQAKEEPLPATEPVAEDKEAKSV